VATFRLFLNDSGGFVSHKHRLPVRAFILHPHLLASGEKDQLGDRLAEFLFYWYSNARNPQLEEYPEAAHLFENPMNADVIMKFMLNPPSGYFLTSKLT
jgi:hypothetical protein